MSIESQSANLSSRYLQELIKDTTNVPSKDKIIEHLSDHNDHDCTVFHTGHCTQCRSYLTKDGHHIRVVSLDNNFIPSGLDLLTRSRDIARQHLLRAVPRQYRTAETLSNDDTVRTIQFKQFSQTIDQHLADLYTGLVPQVPQCTLDHLSDHQCPTPLPCSLEHLDGHHCPRPQKSTCYRPHLSDHTCPPPQLCTQMHFTPEIEKGLQQLSAASQQIGVLEASLAEAREEIARLKTSQQPKQKAIAEVKTTKTIPSHEVFSETIAPFIKSTLENHEAQKAFNKYSTLNKVCLNKESCKVCLMPSDYHLVSPLITLLLRANCIDHTFETTEEQVLASPSGLPQNEEKNTTPSVKPESSKSPERQRSFNPLSLGYDEPSDAEELEGPPPPDKLPSTIDSAEARSRAFDEHYRPSVYSDSIPVVPAHSDISYDLTPFSPRLPSDNEGDVVISPFSLGAIHTTEYSTRNPRNPRFQPSHSTYSQVEPATYQQGAAPPGHDIHGRPIPRYYDD